MKHTPFFLTLCLVLICCTPEEEPELCTTIDFNGYTYNLVQIGDQCWFAENLRTTEYANGNPILGNISNIEWTFTNEGAQGVNPLHEEQDLGRYYNFHAVLDSRNICPTKWHIPSDSEWMSLETNLGMENSELNEYGVRGEVEQIGSSLKTEIFNGSNESGFNAFAAGWRLSDGVFDPWTFGSQTLFWTSTGFDFTDDGGEKIVITRALFDNYDGISRGQLSGLAADQSLTDSWRMGLHVRCLKD